MRAQLSPFADVIGSRVTLEGPSLRLNAAAAQGIGMALHELATSASKYGALSNAAGCVRITWGMAADNDARKFWMTWQELDGPPITPPRRKGFGHTVIGPMAERAIDGSVAIDYHPSGLTWKLTGPAGTTLERAFGENEEPGG